MNYLRRLFAWFRPAPAPPVAVPPPPAHVNCSNADPLDAAMHEFAVSSSAAVAAKVDRMFSSHHPKAGEQLSFAYLLGLRSVYRPEALEFRVDARSADWVREVVPEAWAMFERGVADAEKLARGPRP